MSEPELRLDNDPSERALGLDDLGVPLLWVWVSLEAPVALGVRVKFVDEVFSRSSAFVDGGSQPQPTAFPSWVRRCTVY